MRKLQAFQPDGFWLVTGAAILWGTIGVATKAIYNNDSTTTLFLNLARMLIATPVLLVACWRAIGRETFSIPRRDFLTLLGEVPSLTQRMLITLTQRVRNAEKALTA